MQSAPLGVALITACGPSQPAKANTPPAVSVPEATPEPTGQPPAEATAPPTRAVRKDGDECPQNPSEADTARARELFRGGVKAYSAARYADAAAAFAEAYSLSCKAAVLYNLANAYERSGQLDQAIDSYERYLQSSPDAPQREMIERRLEQLRKRPAP